MSDAAGLSETRLAGAAPLISIVIPVYQGAHWLADSVASVLEQGHEALDLIIVDDGSTDAIEDAVAALPVDARLFRQANAGPAAARNRGIRDAAGDYIAFLDVDDLWPAGALQANLEALLEDEARDVAMGRGRKMERDGAGGWVEAADDSTDDFPNFLGAALFRRRAFERFGLLDARLRFGEDTDWFTRAAEMGARIERQDRIGLLIRRHESNMTLGRSRAEIMPARLFKNALDRKRSRIPAP